LLLLDQLDKAVNRQPQPPPAVSNPITWVYEERSRWFVRYTRSATRTFRFAKKPSKARRVAEAHGRALRVPVRIHLGNNEPAR
jgi:hypothetical protein